MEPPNDDQLNSLHSDYILNLLDRQTYIDRMARLHSMLHDYAEHIGNTAVQEIRITPRKVVIVAKGVSMTFDRGSAQLFPACFLNDGDVEPNEFSLLNEILADIGHAGMVLWDIGSHVGWYPIHWKKRLPSAVVYAFEPLGFNYSQMVDNFALNEVLSIKAFQIGFSEIDGEETFYLVKDRPANGSMRNTLEDPNASVFKCPVTTIDSFVAKGHELPDLIKCDVEGAELAVLRGGLNTLREKKPIVIAEVMRKWCRKYQYDPNDIFDLMSSLGYQCFSIGEGRPRPFARMNESTIETNFLFWPADSAAAKSYLA
jgi:FkbM family methyltransferase